jgi:hypothetical protein
MKHILFVLLLSVSVSSCTLFHFFSPAAQNEINYYASLKGWVQLGETFSTNIYGGGKFTFAVDSSGIPYVFFEDINTHLLFYQFKGGWKLISQNTNGMGFNKAILKFLNNTPLIAILDYNNDLFVYNYSTPAPTVISSGLVSTDVTDFDFQISSDGLPVIAFITNDGSFSYLRVLYAGGSSWPAYKAFTSEYQTPTTLNSMYLLLSRDNHPFLFMSYNLTVELHYDTGGGLQIRITNADSFIPSIANDSISYVFMGTSGSNCYNSFPVASPQLDPSEQHTFPINRNLFYANSTLVSSPVDPWSTYCLAYDDAMVNYYVYKISPSKEIIEMEALPFAGSYSPTLCTGPHGELYLLAVNTSSGSNSITLYRYFD